MTTELLSPKALADLLGLSVNTIYQRKYRGDDLPRAIKLGNRIRFRRSDVEEWLEEHADPVAAAG